MLNYNHYMIVVLPKIKEPKVVTSTNQYMKVWNKYGLFEMNSDQLAVVQNYFEVSNGKPLVFLPSADVNKYRKQLEPMILKAESKKLN